MYLWKMIHTVYIQERALIFFPVYEAGTIPGDKNYQIVSEEDFNWVQLVETLEKKITNGIYCLCENPDQAWISFCSEFDLVVAAGGLVRNPNDEYLLIYRRGKWDLPKGKLDYDELPEHAAIREVEEETGIGQLEIKSLITISFYIYTEKKTRKLKKTHWYLMETTSTVTPQPQIEEDIQEARWMDKETIRRKVISNTYLTVATIVKTILE
jgi:8-oxo-dGTP pyrophosphatase MutT (NUDIX family)